MFAAARKQSVFKMLPFGAGVFRESQFEPYIVDLNTLNTLNTRF